MSNEELSSLISLRETDAAGAIVSFDAFVEDGSIYVTSTHLNASTDYWVQISGLEDATGIEIPNTAYTFSTSSLSLTGAEVTSVPFSIIRTKIVCMPFL